MTATWDEANHAYVVEELRRLQHQLRGAEYQPQGQDWKLDAPPAIEHVAEAFALSSFERDVLLLCAGIELDAELARACAAAQGGHAVATFGLALATLREPHWSALTPAAPLRYWKLVDVGAGDGLVTCPLRIDERVLHHLVGVSHIDERLLGRACVAPPELPESHDAIAAQVAGALVAGPEWVPIQLCGEEGADLEDVAAVACALDGLDIHVLHARDLPPTSTEREHLGRLWAREAVLGDTALLLRVDDEATAAGAFVERYQGPLLVASRDPLHLPDRVLPRFDVAKPGAREQTALWESALGPLGAPARGVVGELVNQFAMSRAAIVASAASVRHAPPERAPELLWEACRSSSRARLDDLAQRIESSAAWEDLVLDPLATEILEEIVKNVRRRARVYDDWGFRAKSARGLGVSALFFGGSGTGKTLAAEVIANELRLDLYRIDVSQVVSKYIGETEKNLRRVFDAAESAGSVLLFDEADALFGKRSEVKDSHDRYANIEVSYLLQRMEAYRGLAVLTTNMRQALDPAFTRRIRFLVSFPFPDETRRADIWRRIFPASTPTAGLEPRALARLNVAGGNIRNIALGAAFLAADEDRPVEMADILRAARAEYSKLDRTLTETEIAGWVT